MVDFKGATQIAQYRGATSKENGEFKNYFTTTKRHATFSFIFGHGKRTFRRGRDIWGKKSAIRHVNLLRIMGERLAKM
jgi:hypothetical protein